MEKKRIQEIFNGSTFLEIPYFQRSYVWTEENWKRFLEDFKEISRGEKDYFLGTYIMKQILTSSGSSKGDLRSVIDGQQRFTTLILFFFVLTKKQNLYGTYFSRIFKSLKGEILLKHNHNDREIFEKIISDEELSEDIKERYKNNNILKAFNFFNQNLNETEFSIDNILEKVYFVPIDLLPDDDEQQIFDTINSLGVRLITSELLKNHLFNDEDIGLYDKTWLECFEKTQSEKEFWDSEVGSRDKHSNLDLFLYAFLNIKVSADVRYKNLFQLYKDYMKDNGCENDKTKKESFIQNMIVYAKLYKKFINPNIENEILTNTKNSINRINILVFALDTSTILPYCLYVLKNAEQTEQGKIFGLIETFIIRRMICHLPTKNYNKKFKTFINEKVLTFDELKKRFSQANDTEDKIPTDEELEVKGKYDHTNLQAKGILYLLETALKVPNKESTSILPISSYDLEHIMPKDWEDFWTITDENEEKRKNRIRHIGFLGNKTILSKGLNKSIKNRDFYTKVNGLDDSKRGYKEFAKGLHTFDFENYQEWNENCIDERFDSLLDNIKTVWEFAPLEIEVKNLSNFSNYPINDTDSYLDGSVIVGFRHNESEYKISAWNQLFNTICKICYKIDSSKFEKIVNENLIHKSKNTEDGSSKCPFISEDRRKLQKAKQIESTKYFSEGTISSLSSRKISKQLLDLYNITDQFEIFVKEKSTEED